MTTKPHVGTSFCWTPEEKKGKTVQRPMKIPEPRHPNAATYTMEDVEMAPNAVCNTVSRIFWLRNKVKEFPPDIQRQLERFTQRFPFEEDLMSGNMERVQEALRQIGKMQPEEVTP